jgi:hypothetical protein
MFKKRCKIFEISLFGIFYKLSFDQPSIQSINIFQEGNLNNCYKKPVEDHELKSSDCKIVKEKMANKTEIDGLSIGNTFLNSNSNTIRLDSV